MHPPTWPLAIMYVVQRRYIELLGSIETCVMWLLMEGGMIDNLDLKRLWYTCSFP